MPILGDLTKEAAEALLWIGVLMALVLILGVVILVVRKQFFDSQTESHDGADLVGSLRAARKRGEISEEEYDVAIARIRAKITGDASATATITPTSTPTKAPQASNQPPPHVEGEHRAPPGFDLTGDPLPRSEED